MKNTLAHIIKLTEIKDKDKILRITREKWQRTYKETPIRLSADFSAETLQAKKEWHDIFGDGREEPTTKNSIKTQSQLTEKSEVLHLSKS